MKDEGGRMKERRALPRFIHHPSSFILICALLAGCYRDDMADDAHAKPLEPSTFFSDGKLARPLINGTVPRGHRMINDPLYAVTGGDPALESANFPFQITPDQLEIGRQKFTSYCAVCHGALGDGNGMIVQRGFPRPPAYYPIASHAIQFPALYPREQSLAKAAPGHFYNVITHGYGAMYSYADRIKSDDRWRIAAYVRALQLSAPKDSAGTTRPARGESRP
jgi:mono/diheme cytochrome c family protein